MFVRPARLWIPLFALQLVHAWANGGALQMQNGRYTIKGVVEDEVPSTTATLWDERLSSLPDEALRAAMAELIETKTSALV